MDETTACSRSTCNDADSVPQIWSTIAGRLAAADLPFPARRWRIEADMRESRKRTERLKIRLAAAAVYMYIRIGHRVSSKGKKKGIGDGATNKPGRLTRRIVHFLGLGF